MQQIILQHVHALAAERGVRILYACETGSRSWGFASPDSDYDVRFVFVHPLRRYLSIQEPQSDINKNYDAKNMMHTIRLLDMAAEILESGVLQVRRPNRDELLRIRRGEYTYDELMAMATEKLERIERLHKQSALPEAPDRALIGRMIAAARAGFYAL